jgi:hypothetical protein
VPTFVVTHTVPQEWVYEGSPFTFVTDGVESAVEQAKAVAGDKDVAVGTASIAQQCIWDGTPRRDTSRPDARPARGRRPFVRPSGHQVVELQSTRVIDGAGVTHLTFRVVK